MSGLKKFLCLTVVMPSLVILVQLVSGKIFGLVGNFDNTTSYRPFGWHLCLLELLLLRHLMSLGGGAL